MSIFDKIAEATYTEGGNYIRPGNYDLEVVKLKVGVTRKKANFFAANFKVLGSSNPECRVGEVVDFFTSDVHDSFLGNVKQFAVALLSSAGPVAPDAITSQLMDGLVDKDGAAVAGSRIRVQVTLVPTKAGGTFSRHLWLPAGATESSENAAA